MIYQNSDLIDCEFLAHDSTIISDFISKFTTDYNYIKSHLHTSTRHFYQEDMNLDRSSILPKNFTYTKLHKFRQIPNELVDLLNFKTLRKECKKLHEKMAALMDVKMHEIEEHEEHKQR